tara:strand:+ start:570 stop:794 length:225 start_codon:yes stop_codon:yes gene_type:complete
MIFGMNIRNYIYSTDEPRQTKIKMAKELDVTEGAVTHWVNGRKKPSAMHSLAIEKITKGTVTRYELRPDIYPKD